ncbi:MAG: hypothetical protein HQK55_10420 [Deltaproteobacteria bacterium]|nr:hypothetical protein [Deltaproteobacteria bacterium]
MNIDYKQVRLSSCVETIIKVHMRLDSSRIDPSLASKFKQLETSLKSIELRGVSERDVRRVEDATNCLLLELKYLFPEGIKTSIYSEVLH